MTNDLLDKLIKKINFEYANNFELAIAKEYSFVPINVQGESFFVAVTYLWLVYSLELHQTKKQKRNSL